MKKPGYILRAPDGAEIIGTEETASAVAYLHAFPDSTAPDGWRFEYTGETEIDANGQESARALGEIVYRDENGKRWLERELKLCPADDEWDKQIAADAARGALEKHIPSEAEMGEAEKMGCPPNVASLRATVESLRRDLDAMTKERDEIAWQLNRALAK